jgi:putative ABC transport system permease protein
MIRLLSSDSLNLLIAAVIAIPFAWWAMQKWLELSLQIAIGPGLFAFAILLVVLIALFTVSFRRQGCKSQPGKEFKI